MNTPKDAGLTILELIIVIAIIGLIGTLGSMQLMGLFGRAKTDTAKLQLDQLGMVLDLYHLDMQRYPTQEEGLQALLVKPSGGDKWNGPYLKKDKAIYDPWGRIYQYRFPGNKKKYDLISYGSDGKEGGEGEAQDIVSWK